VNGVVVAVTPGGGSHSLLKFAFDHKSYL